MDEERPAVERELRRARAEVAESLPQIDVGDQLQGRARAAVGRMVVQLLSDLDGLVFPSTPPPLERVSLQRMYHGLQMFSDAEFVLAPAERTFPRAHMASYVVRAMADLFARQLQLSHSADADDAVRGQLVESLRTEVLALEAAKRAGIDTRSGVEWLARTRELIGAEPLALNVVATLEGADEHEVLTAYRWESAHLHHGTAALIARGRSFVTGDVTVDLGLQPTTLWRLGQLTWAAYGVGMRLITMLATDLGFALEHVRELDEELRSTVRAAATRPIDEEPPSPPYGEFAYPLWRSPEAPD